MRATCTPHWMVAMTVSIAPSALSKSHVAASRLSGRPCRRRPAAQQASAAAQAAALAGIQTQLVQLLAL
jgi:hypothetical protein